LDRIEAREAAALLRIVCDRFGRTREGESSIAQLVTAPLVYSAMRTFIDRCLVNDLSLLWPTEPVWSLETLEPVKERFVVGALFGDDRRFVRETPPSV
jgi:hypothetical protein